MNYTVIKSCLCHDHVLWANGSEGRVITCNMPALENAIKTAVNAALWKEVAKADEYFIPRFPQHFISTWMIVLFSIFAFSLIVAALFRCLRKINKKRLSDKQTVMVV